MFMRPHFVEKLQHRFNRVKENADNIEDVYDGRVYKGYFGVNGFWRNRNNISFVWYSDSIAIFKLSKFSIWPLFLVINELQYKERTKKENIVLAGLWFGPTKPNPNLFLGPVHEHLQQFSDIGYQLNVPGGGQVLVKGKVLCGTCDLQAKGLFMRFKMYNGFFGCTRCHSRGMRFNLGNSSVHIHPYSARMRLRKNKKVEEYARQAVQRGRSRRGVKGPSLLFYIMPNMVRGMGIDIMHGAFLGVAKLLMKLWFSPSHRGERYSLSAMLPVVEERLKAVRPPSFVQRMPRSIKNYLALWKAQEYKLWLLFYSIPIRMGIMNDEYLNHHMQLVSALYILCQSSISVHQVGVAKHLVHLCVSQFGNLYSDRYLSMNVHQLLHLPDTVLDLGSLWVYSCFFLEDLNGQIGKLIHGTRYAGLHVCSGVSVYMNLSILIGALPAQRNVRLFCEKLQSEDKMLRKAGYIAPKMYAVGYFKRLLNVPLDIQVALRESLSIVGDHFQVFHRLRKNGVLYSCADYTRSTLNLSQYAAHIIDNQSHFCRIEQFVRWSNCACTQSCGCLPARFICVGTLYERDLWHAHTVPNIRLSYMNKVHSTAKRVAFDVQALECLCFYLKVNNTEYICKPINMLEIE